MQAQYRLETPVYRSSSTYVGFRYIGCIYVVHYYMVELAIRYLLKMTHTDCLSGRAIRFSYRPVSFGGKISGVDMKTNKSGSGTSYKRFMTTNYEKRS